MATFGLEVTDGSAHAPILKIKERLDNDSLLKNPFEAKVRAWGSDFYVVHIKPVYPPVFYFAVFPLFLFLIFPREWYGVVAGVIAGLMAVLALWWWNRFYFFLFWLATKKNVRYVPAAEALRRVV